MTIYIGARVSRVDGRAKVTGEALYAAEHEAPDLVHGLVLSSPIARGRITRIDASEALAVPGVIHVLSHETTPRLARSDRAYRDTVAPPGSPYRPFHDAEIAWSGQPVALVVADSLEVARVAASLVLVEYARAPHETDLARALDRAYVPQPRDGFLPTPAPRGSPDKALARAAAKIQADFWVPIEHHNPMEPFATTVVRDHDGSLTVYDKTQGAQNVHDYLCRIFDLDEDELRVMAPFVGGAFGSGLRPQVQVFLAVLAAIQLKRSVRVTLTRSQMFTLGHRPTTLQRVALGASRDGRLEALIHEAIAETSRFEDYSETVVDWSGMLYHCDNVRLSHKVTDLDVYTPLDMRAPGAVWGLYALESAMDELAFELDLDPLDLRIQNYADRDQNEGKPFSSKELMACYRQGAERFGWERRSPEPRSMREGDTLIGWGMATGAWEATQVKASSKAVLLADGRLSVGSATEDIGTGTYTVMTQIAADALGIPLDRVTFHLGDSALPSAPVEGGSFTVSSVGSAVEAVCLKIRGKVLKLARKLEGSPLAGARPEDVVFVDGEIRSREVPSRRMSITDVLRRSRVDAIEEEVSVKPSRDQRRYARYTHSAVFAEVKVDADLGVIRVTRVVSAVAGGRVMNPKTAESQVIGGVVWGIGVALEEVSVLDQGFGRFMTKDLAEYLIPVNADVGEIQVIFVEERDEIVNPLGAKGLGEIGVIGVAPAIANAVFHATGRRVRRLPIRVEDLL